MTMLQLISGLAAILWGVTAIVMGVLFAFADDETGWGFTRVGLAGTLFVLIGLGLAWVGVQVMVNAV